jgi:hypothetical protein
MRYFYTILFTLILVSCGVDDNHFKIEGKFQNLNQGEFYVYSPDGGITGLDTIKVVGGEFTYEIPLDKKATFILIFPNFSEQPIFGAPGVVAEVKADASHLKELEVTGSDDNVLMTKFLKQILHLSPPEALKAAETTINENPHSAISGYLLNKYFVQSSSPDYKKALGKVEMLIQNQPGNGRLIQLKTHLENLVHGAMGAKLPSFTAKNLDGGDVSDKALRGKYAIINVWASWNFDSQSIQRQIQKLKSKYGSRLAVMSVCLDVSKSSCREAMDRDSIKWNTVCDEMAWNSPIVKTLGISTMPDNFVFSPDGRIIARNLDMTQIKERVEKILK